LKNVQEKFEKIYVLQVASSDKSSRHCRCELYKILKILLKNDT